MVLAWLWVLVSLVGVFASTLVYLESRGFYRRLQARNPRLAGSYAREVLRDRLLVAAQLANLGVGISALLGAALADGHVLLRLLFQTTTVVGLFAVPVILTAISLGNWLLRRRLRR